MVTLVAVQEVTLNSAQLFAGDITFYVARGEGSWGQLKAQPPPPIMRTSSMVRTMGLPLRKDVAMKATSATPEPNSMGEGSSSSWLFPVILPASHSFSWTLWSHCRFYIIPLGD